MGDPFGASGIWLRCALHAHTTNSDGEMTPEMLARHYEHAGFDVLAITDHWVRTDVPSTERLLVVPSVELNARVDGPGRDAHVIAFGVSGVLDRPADEFPTLTETIEWVHAQSGVAYLAHPYWSGLQVDDFQAADGLAGLEVYNAGCELAVGRGLATVHWDQALEAGRRCFAIAADDSHQPGFDSSLAWVWARCRDRTPEAVLSALADGSFYSTSGPAIDEVAVHDGTIEIRCSAARRVTLTAGHGRGASVNAGRLGFIHRGEVVSESSDGGITAARLHVPPQARYVRIEVVGLRGGTAWTNPLWTS